jgi:chromosome segregation ATPase
MSSLFELSSNVAALEAALDNDGDQTALGNIMDELISNRDSLASKVENYAGYIGELQSLAEARGAEAKRLSDLAKATSAKAQRLKEALRDALLRIGSRKLTTTRYEISIRKAGGKAPLVIDETRITEEWTTTKTIVEPDKERIRAALDAGEVLDFAEITERADVMVIK